MSVYFLNYFYYYFKRIQGIFNLDNSYLCAFFAWFGDPGLLQKGKMSSLTVVCLGFVKFCIVGVMYDLFIYFLSYLENGIFLMWFDRQSCLA